METKDDCESSIYCPECKRQMYALEGALNPIYVCSHCGTSIDGRQLQKNDGPEKNKDSDLDKPLLHDLFPGQFMKKYTAFDSFSDFINNCELFGECIQEINKDIISELPERKINKYVKDHTRFESWDQMFEKAVEWYLKM